MFGIKDILNSEDSLWKPYTLRYLPKLGMSVDESEREEIWSCIRMFGTEEQQTIACHRSEFQCDCKLLVGSLQHRESYVSCTFEHRVPHLNVWNKNNTCRIEIMLHRDVCFKLWFGEVNCKRDSLLKEFCNASSITLDEFKGQIRKCMDLEWTIFWIYEHH